MKGHACGKIMSAKSKQKVFTLIQPFVNVKSRNASGASRNQVAAFCEYDRRAVIMLNKPAGYNANYALMPVGLI